MNIGLSENIKKFCDKIGKDPFLVQAAGGNVSWKEEDVLWVKASGTSLGDALKEEIFIPLNLKKMRDALSNNIFEINEKALNGSKLRPSIETALHTIMNHKIVVHIHSISSLIHLVQEDSYEIINKKLTNLLNWNYIKYFKPGADLAKAVSMSIKDNNSCDVLFLENHGIVVGGDSLDRIEYLIDYLDDILGRAKFKEVKEDLKENIPALENKVRGYTPSQDYRINYLAKSHILLRKLESSWAMFPDHVVFLGPKPIILNQSDLSQTSEFKDAPFIFVKNIGVLQNSNITNSQIEQLVCYFNVINNIDVSSTQRCLSKESIMELLDWDAEVYRQNLSKQSLNGKLN